MRYYVDSCIWLDLLEDRTDGLRPLGEFAFQFIKKAMKQRNTVLYSRSVLKELNKQYPEATIEEHCFKQLRTRRLLEYAETTQKQADEAKHIAKERGLPTDDALHAILARDNQATLVTRDAHFTALADITESVKPENAP